jgi:RNA polymerase sigma-70 factor (ECF subfamily)
VAEEIVQEVFLQLHARWDQVDAPRAWLFRSVRNRAFNYVRDNQREVLNGEDLQPLSKGTEETPEALLLRLEAASVVREMVDQLDETDRTLLKLKYGDGQKYRDISIQTGLSVSNVGYRLHHILKQLDGQLRRRGIDGLS